MMVNGLLDNHGKMFYAKIDGKGYRGKIAVFDGLVYLCQDKLFDNHQTHHDRLGYAYSVFINKGTEMDLYKIGCKLFSIYDGHTKNKDRNRSEILTLWMQFNKEDTELIGGISAIRDEVRALFNLKVSEAKNRIAINGK